MHTCPRTNTRVEGLGTWDRRAHGTIASACIVAKAHALTALPLITILPLRMLFYFCPSLMNNYNFALLVNVYHFALGC